MPNVNEMIESKYLKKEDVGTGTLGTVAKFERVNIAKEGQSPEWKWALFVEELDKPLLLNSTNIRLLEMIFNSPDTDDWIGNKVVLYNDPSIQFQGKLTGGIRLRAPKTQKKAAPTIEDLDSDIPF